MQAQGDGVIEIIVLHLGGGDTAGVWSHTPGWPLASCQTAGQSRKHSHQVPGLSYKAVSSQDPALSARGWQKIEKAKKGMWSSGTPLAWALCPTPHPHPKEEGYLPGGRQQTGTPRRAQTAPPGNGARVLPGCRGSGCPLR